MACIREGGKRHRHGKWIVDFRDGSGVRRWKTCRTKREAEEVLAEQIKLSRQAQPISQQDRDITLADYAGRWLEAITRLESVTPETAAHYADLLRRYVLPRLGRDRKSVV